MIVGEDGSGRSALAQSVAKTAEDNQVPVFKADLNPGRGANWQPPATKAAIASSLPFYLSQVGPEYVTFDEVFQ